MNWAATPLGPVEHWSQGLRTMAASVLGLNFPSMLLWGPHHIQIYNDEFIPFLGSRHPLALGIPARESWPETIAAMEPIYARVRAGETVSLPTHPLTFQRDGASAGVTATLAYAPIRDDNGAVCGIFCTILDQRAGTLLESESRFRLLVDAVQDYGIFMLDANGIVVSWNDGAERIKGYAEHEILGRHFSTFYTPEDQARDHPMRELQLAREVGRHEEAGWRIKKDGSRFWANVTITPVRDEEGLVRGFAKVTRDLTERRKAEQELLDAKNAAEEANRAKGDFLAAMSHELRTPLNAIGGYVDLLDLGIHGEQTAAQRDALSRIMANQRHLLRLINDVLEFVKIEVGHVEFHPRAVFVAELLASMEPLLAPLAHAKRIALTIPDCDASISLMADPDRLRQILINLVGNALKFTPAGGSVSVSCEPHGAWVEIHVRDSGPGISFDKQRTIFEPFVQIDRRLSTRHEGVGLGLAISRDLANAMGGELVLESVPDQGSTFTLRLPLLPVTPTSLAGGHLTG